MATGELCLSSQNNHFKLVIYVTWKLPSSAERRRDAAKPSRADVLGAGWYRGLAGLVSVPPGNLFPVAVQFRCHISFGHFFFFSLRKQSSSSGSISLFSVLLMLYAELSPTGLHGMLLL